MNANTTRQNFAQSPMFWLVVCFAAGILLGKLITVVLIIWAVACVTIVAAAFICGRRPVATWLVGAAFVAGGAVSYAATVASVHSDRLKVLYDNGTFVSSTPVEIDGVLTGRPEPSFDGEFLSLRAERLRYHGDERSVSGNVRVFAPSEISDLKFGSRIHVSCTLEREDEYLNPGVQPKREILDRQNIDAMCSLKSSMLLEHTADESVFLPLAWVYDQRAALIDHFRKNLNASTAGVMIASLLGDKYFLDKDTADLFREGGTFHILVISGLHITFIGGLLLWLLRRWTRNRWLQFLVTTTALWAYTLAVGADVPVVRAAVMFTILLFAYAIYRRGTLLNSLGVSSLVLLVWRPEDLFNPSFQLTFVSVAAIITLAYPLLEHLRAIGTWTPTPDRPFPPNVPRWLTRCCEMLYWRPGVWAIESKRQIWTARLSKSPLRILSETTRKVTSYIFDGIVVSLIVQIAMLPLSVIYFHRVALSGVVLNLWVGFFIAIESFIAVAGALLSHFSELVAYPLFLIADAMNWIMLSLPRLLSWSTISSFRLPAYVDDGRSFYVLFVAPLIIFAVMIARWQPFEIKDVARLAAYRILPATAATLVILIGVIVFHPFSAPRADGRLHIDHLDVGQGDSALITFPNGETWLVDAGGKFDYRKNEDAEPFEPDSRGIGEMVVSEVLWAKGYSHIDHILVTHADADHIEGMNDVAKNFSIGSAIFARTPSDDPDFAALASVLQRRRIPVDIVARGDRFDVGGATVEVLYPKRIDDANAPSDNNNSVVLRIVYGSRAFLLTGDIERQAESELLMNGGTLAADVVKVAHHGSRTSSTSEFVAATHAQFAVISVGRHSPFGHPHPDVVERWLGSGAQVATTGENGMITISTDGRDLTVAHFSQ